MHITDLNSADNIKAWAYYLYDMQIEDFADSQIPDTPLLFEQKIMTLTLWIVGHTSVSTKEVIWI